MKSEFIEYCKTLGMGDSLIQSVSTLCEEQERLLSNRFEDVFVGDYITGEGKREYDTLHFFSKDFLVEIMNFIAEPQVWVAKFSQSVMCMESTKSEYDFLTCTDRSRWALEVRWASLDFVIRPRASGNNCAQLLAVIRKYVLPLIAAPRT